MLSWLTLTQDGTTKLGRKHSDGILAILINGDFGSGGKLYFGYENKDGTYQRFADTMQIIAPKEHTVLMAKGIELFVELENSTNPDINIGIAADFFTAAF